MHPMHDNEAADAWRPGLPGAVVVRARHAFAYVASLLTGARRAVQPTAAAPGMAPRGNAPPFADTEAGWHHL